jgi:hypothetical protein
MADENYSLSHRIKSSQSTLAAKRTIKILSFLLLQDISVASPQATAEPFLANDMNSAYNSQPGLQHCSFALRLRGLYTPNSISDSSKR